MQMCSLAAQTGLHRQGSTRRELLLACAILRIVLKSGCFALLAVLPGVQMDKPIA